MPELSQEKAKIEAEAKIRVEIEKAQIEQETQFLKLEER